MFRQFTFGIVALVGSIVAVSLGRSPAQAQVSAPVAASCGALAEMRIPASSIGLPTSGATIASAELVPAAPLRSDGRGTLLATPDYCKVVGFIAPVDPTAPRINFQMNMPTDWNGKIAQMGGSGTNGSVPGAVTSMRNGPESTPPNAPYALSRGFVVYGSDSGHQNAPGGAGPGARGGPGQLADWMRNTEAHHNLLYAQMKKTHDVAVVLVRALYDRPIRHSYYLGSSQGGREALLVAQRYPQDYDGVFSQVPILPYTHLTVFEGFYRSKAQMGDAWIPASKIPAIAAEVRRQCDALDGIADGIISHYTACNRKFDTSVTPHPLTAIRCPGGKDTGDSCLSDSQITAVNQVHAPVNFPFPLYKGWTSMPGWGTGSESATNWKSLGARPDPGAPLGGNLALLASDPAATAGTADLKTYQKAIQEFSALGDATDPDLAAFQRRGGKLILKVNTTDYTANPRWSMAYYDKVVATMGQRSVDQFLRFYVAAGIFHGLNVGRNPVTNEPVPNYVDFLGLLDDWVEKGTAPADTQVLMDMETAPPFTVKSTFPLCRYPTYAKYLGSGDPREAKSYVCARPL